MLLCCWHVPCGGASVHGGLPALRRRQVGEGGESVVRHDVAWDGSKESDEDGYLQGVRELDRVLRQVCDKCATSVRRCISMYVYVGSSVDIDRIVVWIRLQATK